MDQGWIPVRELPIRYGLFAVVPILAVKEIYNTRQVVTALFMLNEIWSRRRKITDQVICWMPSPKLPEV